MTIITKAGRAAARLGGESCCTCAALLSEVPRYDSSTEKPFPQDRPLECCPRIICGGCIHNNPRFRSYCPYCQISSNGDTTLPPGLRDPPSYHQSIAPGSSSNAKTDSLAEPPPPYTPSSTNDTIDEKSALAPDTLHFLDHSQDSITSLSLRYGMPAPVLRRANNITSDHLLLGRRTVVIPGEYYKGGLSLSPRPIEGEEVEARKAKIRRWMVTCKVHEYDVALLYLEQSDYDIELATEAYFADEEWERTHPVEAATRGKGIVRGNTRGTRLTATSRRR